MNHTRNDNYCAICDGPCGRRLREPSANRRYRADWESLTHRAMRLDRLIMRVQQQTTTDR